MSWEYRVVKKRDGTFCIKEIHYRSKQHKNPDGYSAECIAPYGDSLDELRQDMFRMQAALDKPYIDERVLEEWFKGNRKSKLTAFRDPNEER
jgi:hypothetical protein